MSAVQNSGSCTAGIPIDSARRGWLRKGWQLARAEHAPLWSAVSLEFSAEGYRSARTWECALLAGAGTANRCGAARRVTVS